MIEQHRQEIVGMQVRPDEKTGQLKAARRLIDHYKKGKTGEENLRVNSRWMSTILSRRRSTTIANIEREKRNLKEQVRYAKGGG